MNISYIIVQASGKGLRMRHLTTNKPKALISLFAEPLLLRTMRLYPNSRFVILGSYRFGVLKAYLTKYAPHKNYTLIKTAGSTIGNNTGIKTALAHIPAGSPFMILWCDLWQHQPLNFADFDLKNSNYIGLSGSFPCRWRYLNGRLEQKSSRSYGVAGVFIFAKKNLLAEVPPTGEFCEFLQQKHIPLTPFTIKDIEEIGTLAKFYQVLATRPVSRPFNCLKMTPKTVTKYPLNQQGSDIAKDEANWYRIFKSQNWNFLPQIYGLTPLKLERISGQALYLNKLSASDKEKILRQIIKNLATIHHTFNPKTADYATNNYEIYLAKTKKRLDSVAALIPQIGKKYLIINHHKCLNYYKFWPQVEKLLKPYFTNTYVPIHGDCTFSNTLYEPVSKQVYFIDPRGYFGWEKIWGDPDYDWAKLYYSLVGNYDQFNHKRFKLVIKTDQIQLSIKSNGYARFKPLFFKLTKADPGKINLLQAIIWLSLSAYSWDDYDAICGAFYRGIYLLNYAVTRRTA